MNQMKWNKLWLTSMLLMIILAEWDRLRLNPSSIRLIKWGNSSIIWVWMVNSEMMILMGSHHLRISMHALKNLYFHPMEMNTMAKIQCHVSQAKKPTNKTMILLWKNLITVNNNKSQSSQRSLITFSSRFHSRDNLAISNFTDYINIIY